MKNTYFFMINLLSCLSLLLMATENPSSLNYVCSSYNFVILMLSALLKSIHNVNHAHGGFSNTGVKTHINNDQNYSNRFTDLYLLSIETNHYNKYEFVTK